MSYETKNLPPLNPATFTGFEAVAADTHAANGTYPQMGKLSLAGILFAAVAGVPTALTAVSGAVTSTATKATLTTDRLTLAPGATYTVTVTDTAALATSRVYATLINGTNTALLEFAENALPAQITSIAVAAGSFVITIKNISALNTLNGTFLVDYVVL